MFFHEVNNLNHEIILNDNIDEVYMFSDDEPTHPGDTNINVLMLTENEPPQGVLTNLTGCYSFACRIDKGKNSDQLAGCYSYDCPIRKKRDSVRHTYVYPTKTIFLLSSFFANAL